MRNRRGLAIVVVLTVAFALITMGAAYLRTLSLQSNQNSIELGAVQLDLLAEGVTQVAMLKFKEAPAPLYYSALCAVQNKNAEGTKALDVYNKNSSDNVGNIMRNSFTTPFNITYYTEYTMLPSKLYQNMHAKINVYAKLRRADGTEYDRRIERNIESTNVRMAE